MKRKRKKLKRVEGVGGEVGRREKEEKSTMRCSKTIVNDRRKGTKYCYRLAEVAGTSVYFSAGVNEHGTNVGRKGIRPTPVACRPSSRAPPLCSTQGLVSFVRSCNPPTADLHPLFWARSIPLSEFYPAPVQLGNFAHF